MIIRKLVGRFGLILIVGDCDGAVIPSLGGSFFINGWGTEGDVVVVVVLVVVGVGLATFE